MLTSKIETTQAEAKNMLQGAQDLAREATSAASEKADELLGKGSNILKTAADKAMNMQAVAVKQGKKIAGSTDEYVRDNPWKSVGIAAGAAVLLGAVIARR
ncbi:hypothetical protein BH11PSE11_BH11PSE11_24230 [soil metagenome]